MRREQHLNLGGLMQQQAIGGLRFSATDLVNHLQCQHLTGLNKKRAEGHPGFSPPKYPDPFGDRLAEYGDRHELAYLQSLKDQGFTVAEIDTADIYFDDNRRTEARAATQTALRSGVDVVFQAVLGDNVWGGQADFLVKVETPSELGEWSYEVVDTKLARTAKPTALVQLAEYSEHLATIQGLTPHNVHLVLGDNRQETFPLRQIAPYHRLIKRQFLADISTDLLAVYPDKVEHCQRCVWRSRCQQRRLDDDHLTLVADLGRTQAVQLVEHDIATTLTELAVTTDPAKPPRMGAPTFDKLRQQARIQLEGRNENALKYELFNIDPDPESDIVGLEAIPAPSPGDIFFDIESDVLLADGGLEYLFGWTDPDGNYTAEWALNPAQEKQLLERFIDMLTERLETHPDFHVYHYAPYEEAAIKRLATRHGTREAELDHLLRSEVFIDLYRIVRQSLRASVASYSLKKIELFYGFTRTKGDESVDSGTDSAVALEAWIERGADPDDRHELDLIETYNREDCDATQQLQTWLENLRTEAAAQTGRTLRRPTEPEIATSEDASARQQEIEQLQSDLTAGLPDDSQHFSPEERARWLLAELLMFHRREAVVEWWDFFRRKELCESAVASSDYSPVYEDSECIGGIEYQPHLTATGPRNTTLHTFTFPTDQECKLDADDTLIDTIEGKSIGTIKELNTDTGTMVLSRGAKSTAVHPEQLTAAFMSATQVGNTQRDALEELARIAVRSNELLADSQNVAFKLLTRTPPKNLTAVTGPMASDRAREVAHQLDHDYLAIQGPPGTGKSTCGSQIIVDLISAGYKVGITANSHAVINQLLTKTLAADHRNQVCAIRSKGSSTVELPGVHSQSGNYKRLRELLDNGDPKGKIHGGRPANLFAGTPAAMANSEMQGSLDYLIVDEAGQMALAEALAATRSTRNLILLGDPNQLGQPTRAAHPEGTDHSALDHVIDNNQTMPIDQGVFLDISYRMHPNVCDYISEQFYEGELISGGDAPARSIDGIQPGVQAVAVEHSGRRAWCPEEGQQVVAIVEDLLGKTMSTPDGTRRLGPEDILVVAPYNAAVQEIRNHLASAGQSAVPVGTVDKFQGQEAPVVIASLTSSNGDLAPRGLGFLLDPARLNVAISRAQLLAYVVHERRLPTTRVSSTSHVRNLSSLAALRHPLETPC